MENVVLTAHSGSCSTEARYLMEFGAAQEVIRFLNGEPPLCPVPDEVIKMECSTHTEQVSLEWYEIFNLTEERSDERYKIYRKRWCQYPTHNIVGPYPLNVDIELVHNPIEEYKNGGMVDYFLSDLHPQANLMGMSLLYKIMEEFRRIPEPTAIKLGVRGCVINYPYLKEVLLAVKQANSVETIISIPLDQLAKVDTSVLDSIVDLGLDVLNIFVNTVGKEDVPFEALATIKRGKSMRPATGPKIRIVGEVDREDSESIRMLCDFWSHWADVIALANPLDSVHKVSQKNWNCSRLWQRLMISAEGKFLPCSFDVTEEFCLGHFPEVTIQQAWLGNKMNRLREAHNPNQDNCLQCSQARRKLLAAWQSANVIA